MRNIWNNITSAVTAAMKAVFGPFVPMLQSSWRFCERAGRWLEEKVPGGKVVSGLVGGAAVGGMLGMSLGIPMAGMSLVSGAPLSVVTGMATMFPLVGAKVGMAAGLAVGIRDTVRANGGVRAILGRTAAGAADIAAPAGRSIGRGVGGLGNALGGLVRLPGRILGGISLGGGGGRAAPGADAYAEQAAAAAPTQASATKADPAAALRLASAVRAAAACRADALDDSRPEEAHEKDDGIPAAVVGWLDHLSIDELRVVSRLASNKITTVVGGGQVDGIPPLGSRELGTDCVAVWSAAGLAEATDRIEALRLAVTPSGSMPVTPGNADADMAALHELDQRYRAQLRPGRPSSIHAKWQAVAARNREGGHTPTGLTVH